MAELKLVIYTAQYDVTLREEVTEPVGVDPVAFAAALAAAVRRLNVRARNFIMEEPADE